MITAWFFLNRTVCIVQVFYTLDLLDLTGKQNLLEILDQLGMQGISGHPEVLGDVEYTQVRAH